MPTITWKDKVRVRVGELTRAGQFDLWREAGEAGLIDVSPDADEAVKINWSRTGDNLMAVVATRSIEVYEGDQWRRLETGETYKLLIDDDETVEISFPMRIESFNALPKSLANTWIQTAIDLNGGLHDALFFGSSLVTFTTVNSETPPDNVS